MKDHFVSKLLTLTVLAFILAACGGATTPLAPTEVPATEPPVQSLVVNDQDVTGGIVRVAEVIVVKASWIVIHRDQNGNPGRGIGRIALPAGRHENVAINIDLAQATPLLFAEVHDDVGLPGEFELADKPATPSVRVSFNVTLP